jgi:hypothetical protein
VTAVAELASQLTYRDALVLFPEGSDWTPTRHWLAVRRLRRKGLNAQADAAAGMPNVLPPRPAGTFAALQAAPAAEVAVFMHTGHDELLDAASIRRCRCGASCAWCGGTSRGPTWPANRNAPGGSTRPGSTSTPGSRNKGT